MRSWIAKQVLSRTMARVRAGDTGPTLRMDADDVRFRFPGDSSWATELEGKAELSRWLDRFVDAGLQIYPDEVVVKGWPWNATLCVRGTDHLDAPDGRRVYDNRYVIWGRMRWLKLQEYEVYEDTTRTAVLDDYLAARTEA